LPKKINKKFTLPATGGKIRIDIKPGGPGGKPPIITAVNPAAEKKKQKALLNIQQKIADIDKSLNAADYKKAFRLAAGEIKKYTIPSIEGNDLLGRIAGMAETALEYLHARTPETDDLLLDFLGGELENYKEISLYALVRTAVGERLAAKVKQLKDEGHDGWIPKYLDTWAPWVKPPDARSVNAFLGGSTDQIKWKFASPVKFQAGERQKCLDARKRIMDALAKKAKELAEPERAPAPVQPASVAEEAPGPVLPPEAPITRISKSGSSGVFSKKKAVAEKAKPVEAPKAPSRSKKPKKTAPVLASKEDDTLHSHEVWNYLVGLKRDKNVSEVHFLKIKTDLNVISLNKERKLFKILERFVLKGYVLRKAGNIYVLLM
jgi:hypothetical protein